MNVKVVTPHPEGPAVAATLSPRSDHRAGAENGADGRLLQIAVLEAAMPPMIGASIVAIEHERDRPLVTLMVGIGIPLAFLTLPAWYHSLGGF